MLTKETIKTIGADHADPAVAVTRICGYVRKLEDMFAYRRFEHILVKHALVTQAAVDDPEGYDNWRTHGAIHAAHRELTQP